MMDELEERVERFLEDHESVDLDAIVEQRVQQQLDRLEEAQGESLPRTTKDEVEDAVFELKDDGGFDRRTFMKLLGGGMAGAGLAGLFSSTATAQQGNFRNRPSVSNGGRVSVPGDYSTLQGAIDNEVGILMNGQTRINVSSGSIEDEGDIVVPGFIAGEPGGIETGGQLRIYGSNTAIKSINVVGTNGLVCPYIRGFAFTGTSDLTDDGAAGVVQGSRSVTFKDNTFDGSQDHALLYYAVVGGKVVDNNFGGAPYGLRIKRGGFCSMVNCSNAGTLVKLSHGFARTVRCSGKQFEAHAGVGFHYDENRMVGPYEG